MDSSQRYTGPTHAQLAEFNRRLARLFGENLRYWRSTRCLTQEALAMIMRRLDPLDKAKFDRRHVIRHEHETRGRLPTLETVNLYAMALGVRAIDLLFGVDQLWEEVCGPRQ